MRDIGNDVIAIERERVKSAGMMLATVAVGLFGLLGYAASTSVAKIAMGTGVVVVDTRVQTLGAADGGLVSAVLVRPLQHVSKGQALIELDPTAARAEYERLRYARQTALADVRRIEAEIGGRAPDWDSVDAAIAEAAQGAWAARTATRGQERIAKEAEAAALERMIVGLKASTDANQRILDSQSELLPQKLIAANKVEAQRSATVETRGRLEKAQADLLGVRAQIAGLHDSHRAALQDDLEEARGRLSEATQQAAKVEAMQAHLTLISPVDGRIKTLAVHGAGFSAKAGEPLIEIVEDDVPLFVDATIQADDLGYIRAGASARILKGHGDGAFDSIEGTVTAVAPDSSMDSKERLTARLEVRPNATEFPGRNGAPAMPLVNGIPVTVYVQHGEHSLLQSLFGDAISAQRTAIESVIHGP